MSRHLAQEARQAIVADLELQDCFRRMQRQSNNPRVRAILHDLLLMEEMNEVLLRSLTTGLA